MHRSTKRSAARAEAVSVALASDRTLDVVPSADGVSLRLRSAIPGEAMEIELRFEAGGTTVRLQAPTVELSTSGRLVAECEAFCVKARQSIELHSEGTILQSSVGEHNIRTEELTVDASPGAVRLRANDDVQLLGELILLNCDRTPAMPEWVPPGRDQAAALPAARTSGDEAVLAEMLLPEG